MRVSLLLCRLDNMAFSFLRCVWLWLWARLTLLRLCAVWIYSSIVSQGRRLPWSREDGIEARGEVEDEERGRCGGKRPAAKSERERDLKRVKHEEENEDEDDRVETTDEYYCDFDSTWETEEGEEGEEEEFRESKARKYHRSYKFNNFERAARDMQNYRRGYPGHAGGHRWRNQSSNHKPNLDFYLGNAPTKPDGVYIQEFHDGWYGQYDTLEYVHSYIQWLFPLQEPGMNFEASPLTPEEVEDFCNNATAKHNLLKSYKLMLDFYGIELCDENTGEVRRAENWRDRFNNLNRNTHNNLRITRILKCLGTLGFSHYQAPLVHFFLKETLVNRLLPNVKDSVLNYFLFAVLDKTERRDLVKFAYFKYGCKQEFVWCPKKLQRMWSAKANENDCDPRPSSATITYENV